MAWRFLVGMTTEIAGDRSGKAPSPVLVGAVAVAGVDDSGFAAAVKSP